jgi:MFS transporter, OFA family, oxalate/formate antiporter
MAFLLIPLVGAGSFIAFSILSLIVMNCYGGGYGTISALVTTYYGSRDLGPIYGRVYTSSCAVAGFGAQVILARSPNACNLSS